MPNKDAVDKAHQQVQASVAALDAATQEHDAKVRAAHEAFEAASNAREEALQPLREKADTDRAAFDKAQAAFANNSLIDALVAEAKANRGISPATGEKVADLEARRPK